MGSAILSIAEGALKGTLARREREAEDAERQRRQAIEDERLTREREAAALAEQRAQMELARERAAMESQGFRFGVPPAISAASQAINSMGGPDPATGRTAKGVRFPVERTAPPVENASGITYHRELSPEGRHEAAQRAAHQRLAELDPTVPAEFDPETDYLAYERKLRQFQEFEEGLKRAGYSDDDARMLARHNVDMEERRAQQEDRAQRSSIQREDQAFQRQDRAEEEAAGLAQLMAEDGHDVRTIVSELEEAYPNMRPGILAAVAAEAVRTLRVERSRGRSSSQSSGVGIQMPDGSTLQVPLPQSAAAESTGNQGMQSGAALAQQRRAYDAAAAQLRRQGKSAAQIQRVIGQRP